MQVSLARTFFWLMTLTSAALVIRAATGGGPLVAATLSLAIGTCTLVWSYRPGAPVKPLALALFTSLVLLIGKAALELGGAAGSPLAFAYTPGYVAMLVVGPIWGWGVTLLMLGTLVSLWATTPLPTLLDRLRLIDQIAMTVFAAGLGHALVRSFLAYEAAIRTRATALLRLGEDRAAMIRAIYERLEPLSSELARGLEDVSGGSDRRRLGQLASDLIGNLKEAKALFGQTVIEATFPEQPDHTIRRDTMRVWLRLAAALMAFFVVRNITAHSPFVPSIVTIGSCLAIDFWLTRPAAQNRLELTALALALMATVPMIVHIREYGATADAPPLVVTPATVLFTTLLSQGPATWVALILHLGILGWVGLGAPMSLNQSRLLGNIAMSFLIVVAASRAVFALRHRYARALLEQGRLLAAAARQRRRLAGTLFHDVSNHLQALSILIEYDDLAAQVGVARSLSRRVKRLIALSKEFLLPDDVSRSAVLEPIRIGEAVESLQEAFGPRLAAKQLRLETGRGLDLIVRAQADLFIESVLGNLLSNAIKFSAPASIITLNAEQDGANVRLVVGDHGPGFPAEIMRHLGEDGALPSRPGTAGEPGQGFGLQLAVEHLHRMDGHLELRNGDQGGASATIWLPASTPPPPRPA
ncbi:MAG TPA: ATP-binding protein [Polyangia bacterium]|nr:ATP-binding protein [Polyangia bacterium]